MIDFFWNMAISFQLLFIIISGVIFFYIKDKSFKYYALYNIFLLLYLAKRNLEIYHQIESWASSLIGASYSTVFMVIFNFFIQVIFYNFYILFGLYFLDLDRAVKNYFSKVRWVLKFLGALFFFFAVMTLLMRNSSLFISLFTFIYLPIILTIFILSVFKALKHSGKHKDFFLFGVCIYVLFALIAFAGTFIPSLKISKPVTFFYIGIVIETIFFSLGLAYKMKILNDEKNRARNLVTLHKHQQEITKLQGLIEGEEKERKRMAEELHDGITGDLYAIKLNLALLNRENSKQNNEPIFHDLSKIINKSCQQIREISHYLSPSTITNFGLIGATDQYCKEMGELYKLKINFTYFGGKLELPESIEIHIYRIIQELVNNIVKHSEAHTAEVKIVYEFPMLEVSVKDNGKGFSVHSVLPGIGLSNINSRIKFMNGKVKKESNNQGSFFHLTINLKNVPKI